MYLRPHHLQAAERHYFDLAHRSEQWNLYYNWGIREIDLDLDALANYRLVVRTLKARLRDGTLIAVPEDGVFDAVDLRENFERAGSLTVYVAVPVFRQRSANVCANGTSEVARYLLETQEFEDENTGINPQFLQLRLLNLKLLLSTQDHAGYEILPIAQIRKGTTAVPTPQLDKTYIPALLACDAWSLLGVDILQAIYDRVGNKIDVMADQVIKGGINFDSQAQGDALILNQLRVLNEAYAWLGIEVSAKGVHPLAMYTKLCGLVGQLAIFDATRRPPNLPQYDHDNLGGCFYRVKQYLDALLDVMVEPEWKERHFTGAGLRMQVTLEPAWLEPQWQLFVGVESNLNSEECDRLLNALDRKIASSDRVEEIYRRGEAGLRLRLCPQPPHLLRSKARLTFFQIDRESQPDEWKYVQRSLMLAIRLNLALIASDIQGQRLLTIKEGGQTIPLQLTLYVVPAGKT
jgi:type VI secretion system protein ImpJ